MTHHEIVKKIVGPIDPVGCSARDAERFENLKALCILVEALILDIDDVAYNRNSHEFSVKRAGEYAQKFLAELTKEFSRPPLKVKPV